MSLRARSSFKPLLTSQVNREASDIDHRTIPTWSIQPVVLEGCCQQYARKGRICRCRVYDGTAFINGRNELSFPTFKTLAQEYTIIQGRLRKTLQEALHTTTDLLKNHPGMSSRSNPGHRPFLASSYVSFHLVLAFLTLPFSRLALIHTNHFRHKSFHLKCPSDIIVVSLEAE